MKREKIIYKTILLIVLISSLNPTGAYASQESKAKDSKDNKTVKESNKNPKAELPKNNPKPNTPKNPAQNPPSNSKKNPTPITSPSIPIPTITSIDSVKEEKKYLSSALATKVNKKFNSLVKSKAMNAGQAQAVTYAFITSLETRSEKNLINQITNLDTNKFFKYEQVLSLVKELEGNYSKTNLLKQGRELNLTQKQIQILKLCNDLNNLEKQEIVNETLNQLLSNGTITDQLKTQLTLTLYALLS
jgi:hypothetical protein